MSNGNNNGHHRNGTGNGLVHANGNGHKPDAAIVTEHDLLWDGSGTGSRPSSRSALGQPLDPALVSQRKGRAGRTFDYLEGHVVIDQANRVFGYGGWGMELVGDVTLRQIETVDTQTGEVKVTSAYSAPVRVTVAGALPRTDIGFHAVTPTTTAEGHDTAIKGAGDGWHEAGAPQLRGPVRKRLYGDQQPVGGSPRPERVPVQPTGSPARPVQPPHSAASLPRDRTATSPGGQTLRKRLIEIAVEQGFDEDGVRTAVVDRMGKSIDDLTAAELGPLVEAAANKLNQMRQAQAA